MAMGTFTLMNKAKEYIGDGTIDLDGDTFKAALIKNAGGVDITDDPFSDVSGSIADNVVAITLTSVTWTQSGATVTFTSAAMTFTSTGGAGVARHLVIFDDTVSSPVVDPMIGFALLNSADADVTILEDDTLVLTPPAGGIFAAS